MDQQLISEILGGDFYSLRVETAQRAMALASDYMARGRQAVSYQDAIGWVVSYSAPQAVTA
jgi:hypothetical protein